MTPNFEITSVFLNSHFGANVIDMHSPDPLEAAFKNARGWISDLSEEDKQTLLNEVQILIDMTDEGIKEFISGIVPQGLITSGEMINPIESPSDYRIYIEYLFQKLKDSLQEN